MQSNFQYSMLLPLLLRGAVKDFVQDTRRRLSILDCLLNFWFEFSFGQRKVVELNLKKQTLNDQGSDRYAAMNLCYIKFPLLKWYR